MDLVRAALEWLSGRTRTAPTEWALGIEARLQALLGEGEAAESCYRESIERLGRTRIRAQLARAHLLYGEWLRRERRRGEAREQLRTAHDMLDAMGMDAFAVWEPLAEYAHLVAIDLPGFGHSQRCDALASPKAMGEFIIRACDAFRLEHAHVIGPDIGTAPALFAAAQYPDRLRSLAVGGGAAAVPLQLGGLLKDWVETSDPEFFRRADPRQLVASALADMRRYVLPDPVQEDYFFSYQGSRFAESMRYMRNYPACLPVLADLLSRIQTPVQIIAGAHDTTVPPVNAEFLHQRLPHSRLDIIDAGHFTWEDAAVEYSALITNWWRGDYAATGPR